MVLYHSSEQTYLYTYYCSFIQVRCIKIFGKFYVQERYDGPIKWSSNAIHGKQCLIFFNLISKFLYKDI